MERYPGVPGHKSVHLIEPRNSAKKTAESENETREMSKRLPDAVQKSRPRMEIDRSEGVKTTKSTKTSHVSKSQNRFNKSFIEFYPTCYIPKCQSTLNCKSLHRIFHMRLKQLRTAKAMLDLWLVGSFAHSKLFGPNLWLIVQAQAYSTCSFLQFLTF